MTDTSAFDPSQFPHPSIPLRAEGFVDDFHIAPDAFIAPNARMAPSYTAAKISKRRWAIA